MAQLSQLPADPGRMRSSFQSHATAWHSAEHLFHRLPGRRQLLLHHSDRQLLLFENLLPSRCHSAILFHKLVSFPLRLERVDHWERIASRWRPAFSSHLRNGMYRNVGSEGNVTKRGVLAFMC